MSMHDLLASMRSHWLTIITVTGLLSVAAGVFSMVSTPLYQSTSMLVVALRNSNSATDLNQGSTYTRDQMNTYALVASQPVVLQPVIDDLDLDMKVTDLRDMVQVTVPQNTTALEITVKGPDGNQVTDIANAIATGMIEQVKELSATNEKGKSTIVAKQVRNAIVPRHPISPNTKRNVLAGFVIGLVSGLLIAYLRDVLDTRVTSSERIEAVLGAPVLAKISSRPERKVNAGQGGRAGRAGAELMSLQPEELRRFRTNLEYLDLGGEKMCLVFSSALPGEGRTVVCCDLAQALAETGERVLVIDADMRRPRVAGYFGVNPRVGLSDVLIGRATLESVTQPVGGSLDVLASGEIPPNPSQLLGSFAMRDLLRAARKRYGAVLIDSPPLLPVVDAIILSRISSGVILVADTRRVRDVQLQEAADSVVAGGGIVRGVVLNRMKASHPATYQYGADSTFRRHGQENVRERPLVSGPSGEPETRTAPVMRPQWERISAPGQDSAGWR